MLCLFGNPWYNVCTCLCFLSLSKTNEFDRFLQKSEAGAETCKNQTFWSMHDLSLLLGFIYSRVHNELWLISEQSGGLNSLFASIHSLSIVLSECYGRACWWQTPVQSHCPRPGRWARRSRQQESWILVWIFCRLVKASGLRCPLSLDPSRKGSGCRKGARTPRQN